MLRGWAPCAATWRSGFELDIITMVLLGGVSIFGGSGSLWGVLLSVLIILNLRNGMGLANLSGHVQTGVIGVLLDPVGAGAQPVRRLRARLGAVARARSRGDQRSVRRKRSFSAETRLSICCLLRFTTLKEEHATSPPHSFLSLLIIFSMLLAACAPAVTPAPEARGRGGSHRASRCGSRSD
jgi:hypothetical protein